MRTRISDLQVAGQARCERWYTGGCLEVCGVYTAVGEKWLHRRVLRVGPDKQNGRGVFVLHAPAWRMLEQIDQRGIGTLQHGVDFVTI